MRIDRFLAAFLLIAGLQFAPHVARAAEGYDNCAGIITTLPTTISTQGVWCMQKDLSTAIISGSAITIATNNVTIDCNDFKLGGLAAGEGTHSTGVYAYSRQNITIRHCNVRGFMTGIELSGSGHLVEDNRLDNNYYIGIKVGGDHNLVRGNRVYDTGTSDNNSATGIQAAADIVDNIVDGVAGTENSLSTHTIVGIWALGAGARVEGNRISGLQPYGTGNVSGVSVSNSYMTVSGNNITATAEVTGSVGISGAGGTGITTFCPGNTIANFATPASNCSANGGANFNL